MGVHYAERLEPLGQADEINFSLGERFFDGLKFKQIFKKNV